ncbi:MAG: DPP IV N-terminal domain-containing protein [Candidatus Acidiferrales bacterium]
MRACCRGIIPSLILFSLACLPALAQGTKEDYDRAQKFLAGNLSHTVYVADVSPHWLPKSSRFTYRKMGAKGAEFILVDPAQNTSGPAFDQARLADALTRASQHTYTAGDLPFWDFDMSADGKTISFEIDKDSWKCTLDSYECSRPPGPSHGEFENVSPDGQWAAFLKDHNLYVRRVPTGQIVQLTFDGVAEWDYAAELPTLRALVEQGTQDIQQVPAVFWSPDSTKLVTYRLDSRNAGRLTSLQYVPPDQLRPKAFSVVYQLPGETLPTALPIIFDLSSGTRVDVKTTPLELPFQDGPGFEWFPDGKRIFYDYDTRGEKTIEMRVVDATTGDQSVVFRESSEKYVDPGETSIRFIQNTGEMVVTSERDGWDHLYLFDKTGQMKQQLTQGPWVVHRIEFIDEKTRRVYFLAGGREKGEDPYQTHLYSVGLDGKGLTLLTPENANHSVSISPDAAFFVDNYSRPDLPAVSVLRRLSDGSVVKTLEQSDVSEIQKMGWKFPEPFEGKSSDGSVDLYGLIWRPTNLDPTKKYPVIEQIYTGPQDFFVPKSFRSALYSGFQSVADLGFVVVMVDGRGTTGRSRSFHEFSYRNLGGAFGDHVAMIKQMAEKYPYMDITRVGIYGTSAGGYGAAHAMLMFPDFYKVCVSISGDHDPRLDKAWWNELYQGYPVGADYAEQSNVTIADKLQGHLLLEHGDVDDNVHPAETMRFVNALIKANKNFDMLFVPNMFHGENSLYLVRRRWDYFVQNLLGVTPPADIELHDNREGFRMRRR